MPLVRECVKEALSDKKMIQQYIKEAIVQEGTLSLLINECVRGIVPMLVESVATEQVSPKPARRRPSMNEGSQTAVKILGKMGALPNGSIDEDEALAEEEQRRARQQNQQLFQARQKASQQKQEAINKVINATGVSKVFKNSQIDEQLSREVKGPEDFKGATEASGPRNIYQLRGIDPQDPGVDISGIIAVAGGKQTWKEHLTNE